MHRLIVVEGPDGAGKSTLLSRLGEDLGRLVVHSGGPPADMSAWINKLALVWGCVGRLAILDRIPHISERVYGPIGGRQMEEGFVLMRELIEIDPIVVYCRLPSVMEMFGAMDTRPKTHKPIEHTTNVLNNFQTIVRSYDTIIKECIDNGIEVIPYSWKDNDYDQLVEKLKCVD